MDIRYTDSYNLDWLSELGSIYNTVAILTHVNADIDGAASALVLKNVCEELGAKASVFIPKEGFDKQILLLPESHNITFIEDNFESNLYAISHADLVILTDLSEYIKLPDYLYDVIDNIENLVVIDHRYNPEMQSRYYNLIDGSAAATCEIIEKRIIPVVGGYEDIGTSSAFLLLTGILSDTNNLAHPAVTEATIASVHRILDSANVSLDKAKEIAARKNTAEDIQIKSMLIHNNLEIHDYTAFILIDKDSAYSSNAVYSLVTDLLDCKDVYDVVILRYVDEHTTFVKVCSVMSDVISEIGRSFDVSYKSNSLKFLIESNIQEAYEFMKEVMSAF